MTTTHQTNSLVFHKFNDLPREIQLMIWENALPGPRLVHIYQKPLRTTVKDWERAYGATRRSDWLLAAGMITADEVDRIKPETMVRYYGDELDGSTPPADDDAIGKRTLCRYKSISEPVRIALACKDAFGVVSKHYRFAFHSLGSFPQTLFNFELDTLYIRDENIRYFYPGLERMLYDGFHGPDVLHEDDRRKIERLAVELRVDHAGDGELELSFYDSSDNSGLTELFVDIMRCFPSLKNLTFVVDHYESTRIGPSKDKSIISLIDPIDVDEAIDNYNSYEPEPWNFQNLPDEPVRPWNSAYMYFLEVELWEELLEAYGLGTKTPDIEFKVAITKERKDELDWSRKLCQKSIDKDNEALDKWVEQGCPSGDGELEF